MNDQVNRVREAARQDKKTAAGELIAMLMPNAVAVFYKRVLGSAEHKIFDRVTGKELRSDAFRKAIQEGLKDLLEPAYYTEGLDKHEDFYNKEIENLYYWLTGLRRLGHLTFDVYFALNDNERSMKSDQWRLHKIELDRRLVDEKDYELAPIGTKVSTPDGKKIAKEFLPGWVDLEDPENALGQSWGLAHAYPYVKVDELPKRVVANV